MDIAFDPRKSERCFANRGFDFAYAARIFLGDFIAFEDVRQSYGEIRLIAIGPIDGDLYKVVYTDRGDARRIISANRASRQERRRWQSSK